ncbi:MAG: MFS transporter [Chloroflexota bacterium]|nr:MFS transporter [Chloroflexota bacterium]
MLRQIRLLIGISVFWLPLSMLFDGINTLVLPLQISELAEQNARATNLGLLTFIGLLAGAFVQPLAGALSDRWQSLLGRKWFIGIGLLLSLASLLFFSIFHNIFGVLAGYLAIQVSASIAQAGQQGLIPDLVDENQRGLASGLKGFMDIMGAMLGFVILGQLLSSDQPSLALGAIAVTLIVFYLIAVLLTPEDKPTYNVAAGNTAIPINQVFRLDLTQHAIFARLLVARFLFLLGIYAIGRFLLFFVAERLGLPANQAAGQAGNLLAGLALITILASPLTGWLADRVGRLPLMAAGTVLATVSALMLIWANSTAQILLFGGLMSLGSAAFAGGSWALTADLVPKGSSARFFGLANFSTAGSAAVAGLLGPIIDWVERISPGNGYTILFIVAAIAFLASVLPLRHGLMKEVRDVGEKNRNKRKDRADATGLVILSIPANPAAFEEDQNPQGRTTQL